MLQLDLSPGDGLGPFRIGSSLWSILALVRQPQSKTLFPSVNIIYDTTSPSNSIVIVHLHPYIDLLFTGKGQRLHTIVVRRLRHGLPASPKPAVYSLGTPGTSASSLSTRSRVGVGGSALTLKYKHTIVSSPDEVLRKLGVMKSFGPTYEGDLMKYPGISFSIFDEDGASSTTALMRATVGLSVDESKRSEVKKIVITQKTQEGGEVDAFDEVLECPVMDGDLSLVCLRAHEGVDLYFFPSGSAKHTLLLGVSTAEDIRYELGEPMSIYYKEDDRISIHAPSNEDDAGLNNYFMNYFNHGIDCFVDGSTHILKKIIVHSNTVSPQVYTVIIDPYEQLGSPLFQRYKRCPWEISDPSSGSRTVQYSDSFEKINTYLSRSSEPSPPMVLDRSEDHDALSIQAFSTRLFGFDGILLEVTAADQVVSVTIY